MVNMVRDGKKVWPTCPECGCRYEITKMASPSWNDDGWTLAHFEGETEDRDARGHLCELIDAVMIYHKGQFAWF